MNIFTKVAAISVTSLSLAFSASAQTSIETQKSITPKAVLSELLEGNKRYMKGDVTSPEILKRIEATTKGQHPKAVTLSCLDSRVPVEIVFDQGIGDLFVGRVAGNVENVDQLRSMEFATKLAGSKLVMVLGHTACGAVKGACDHAEMGNLTALLAKIKPAVEAVKGHEEKGRNSKNIEFVNDVVEANVRQTVSDIRERSKVLADLEKSGDIMIVGAVYDLHTGGVTLLK